MEPMLKDMVGQRNSSAMKLATFICGGNSWSEIKSKIFEKYKSKCLEIAQRDDNCTWRVLDDEVDQSHFGQIFSFRLGSHVKKLENETRRNDWLVAMRQSKLSLSIYKYGNVVSTKNQLIEFTNACIAPRNQDRSGAPNEATIQEYVQKLHAKWDETWDADYPIWRLWANHIVRPPLLAWEFRVNQAPPPMYLHTSSQRHLPMMPDCKHFIVTFLQESVDIANQRLALFQQALVSKREILVAMENDLTPISDDVAAPLGFNDIENVRDKDHDFTLDDME
ncbi:hypothetical protein LEN26_014237 [Aphanomyces euteiches]|nr:hypothetical protein LEN26_014237 [Aphanomyces euteiches]